MEGVSDGEGMGLGGEGGDNVEVVERLGGGGEEGGEVGRGVGGKGSDEAEVEGDGEGEREEGGDDGGEVGVGEVGVERFPEGGWEGEVGVVGGLRVVPGLMG